MEVRWILRGALAGIYSAAVAVLITMTVTRLVAAKRPDDGSARWTRPDLKLVSLARLGRLKSLNYAAFESGNIGLIERQSATRAVLNLRSDNDDALPKFWRQWWYLKLDQLPKNQVMTMTVQGAGQWSYYLPFYSYDNVHWHQFEEQDVTQPSRYALQISRRFTQESVWLARYVPYPYSKLQTYLRHLDKVPNVVRSSLGKTPEGRDIPVLTITNAAATGPKSTVMIHARTHPGEVGSSFMLEGLIDYLLSAAPLAKQMRDQLVFVIVPMFNVDGVVAGNNRVNPRGINLEGKWYTSEASPLELDDSRVPAEVRLLHDLVRERQQGKAPVTIALNLHSSAGEPEDNVFFFPHFGPKARGYAPREASLYGKQRRFIDAFCSAQGRAWFNPPPDDGSRSFLAKAVPETWWWKNFRDGVMALSIESTYGRAGRTKRWIKPEDMHAMGASLAKAIARYHELGAPSKALAH